MNTDYASRTHTHTSLRTGEPLAELDTAELVAVLTSSHPALVRTQIDRLNGIFSPEADDHLRARWRRLALDLQEHMGIEEREIYPGIVAAPACGELSGPVAIIARAALVDRMVHEHRQQGAELQALCVEAARVGADGVRAPLERLAAVIREHHRIEADVLFPRLVSCLS